MNTPDNLTYNRRLLDQVRALLLGKSLDDVAMYKIGTRELTKIPLNELRTWEAELERRVVNERRRRAGNPRRGGFIIFSSAHEAGPHFAGLVLWVGRVLSVALLGDAVEKLVKRIVERRK